MGKALGRVVIGSVLGALTLAALDVVFGGALLLLRHVNLIPGSPPKDCVLMEAVLHVLVAAVIGAGIGAASGLVASFRRQ